MHDPQIPRKSATPLKTLPQPAYRSADEPHPLRRPPTAARRSRAADHRISVRKEESQWDYMSILLIVWGVFVACLLGLLAYNATLTRYEEDQLFLSDTNSR